MLLTPMNTLVLGGAVPDLVQQQQAVIAQLREVQRQISGVGTPSGVTAPSAADGGHPGSGAGSSSCAAGNASGPSTTSVLESKTPGGDGPAVHRLSSASEIAAHAAGKDMDQAKPIEQHGQGQGHGRGYDDDDLQALLFEGQGQSTDHDMLDPTDEEWAMALDAETETGSGSGGGGRGGDHRTACEGSLPAQAPNQAYAQPGTPRSMLQPGPDPRIAIDLEPDADDVGHGRGLVDGRGKGNGIGVGKGDLVFADSKRKPPLASAAIGGFLYEDESSRSLVASQGSGSGSGSRSAVTAAGGRAVRETASGSMPGSVSNAKDTGRSKSIAGTRPGSDDSESSSDSDSSDGVMVVTSDS